MKTLIYQVWEGNILPGAKLSINHIKEYADRIGADHWFDHNPGVGYRKTGVQKYWEWLNPLWKDEFLEYDKVAVLDLDIYTVKDLNENIFDQDFGHFSIADEPHTPYKRKANPNGRIGKNNDEKWAADVKKIWGGSDLPRNKDGLLKAYNAGVVLFSKDGIKFAREKFVNPREYIQKLGALGNGSFYCLDQNYFHANMFITNSEYTELSNDWNNLIYWYGDKKPFAPDPACGRMVNDPRNENTKFIHIQLSAADHWLNERKLDRIINEPNDKWNL